MHAPPLPPPPPLVSPRLVGLRNSGSSRVYLFVMHDRYMNIGTKSKTFCASGQWIWWMFDFCRCLFGLSPGSLFSPFVDAYSPSLLCIYKRVRFSPKIRNTHMPLPTRASWFLSFALPSRLRMKILSMDLGIHGYVSETCNFLLGQKAN
jgi:hypothetical protein